VQKRDSLASISTASPKETPRKVAFVSPVPTKKSILKTPRASAPSMMAVTPDVSRRRSDKKSRRLSIHNSRSSTGTVKFGANVSARYNKRDPPNRFELVPTDVQINADMIADVEYDEETKRNESILAEWDEISDASDLDNEIEDAIEVIGKGRGPKIIVEEEEIHHYPDSPNVTVRRRKRDRRTVVQRDVVFCKHCKRGTICTSTFVYE
jgi:hypothetical protein